MYFIAPNNEETLCVWFAKSFNDPVPKCLVTELGHEDDMVWTFIIAGVIEHHDYITYETWLANQDKG